MGRTNSVWVRVAVFAADFDGLDRAAPATVRDLGASEGGLRATPVHGPPSGNAAVGAVDLYYAVPASCLRVGQRVAVDLPLRGAASGLVAPASAILRDIHGGEWVYVRIAPHVYERRRVELAALNGDRAQIVRGPAAGAQVVSAGAAELFGTEFGTK